MLHIEYALSITNIPKPLTASIPREIISCMKSFYYLKLKAKQDRDLMGSLSFIHLKGHNKGLFLHFL